MRALNSPRVLFAVLLVGSACAAVAANIGPDDRQVSVTGLAGTVATDAVTPAVAFDPASQRYLLVWSADEDDGDFRIYGRLLTGSAGAPATPVFSISPVGPAGTDHRQPAVAFSPEHDQFLVAWSSDVVSPGAYEILGQLVDGDGQLIGATQRYSDMGSVDADAAFDAVTPDLAWHPFLDAFTVVWAADDDLGDLSDGRFEVYGQLVDGATGSESGVNDFRITYSLADPSGNDVLEPTVAVHPSSDRWFVAFEGDVADDGIHDPEIWMYGCTADVPDGSAVNLSLMGGGLYDGFSARHPDLAWIPSSSELVCLWDGQDGSGNSPAIYGQRVSPAGALIGTMLPFSAGAGTAYGDLREATHPVITVDPVTDEWFVTWRGDLDDGLLHFDHEIWARRFNDVGAPIDAAAFPLSGMDPSQGPVAGAGVPGVAVNGIHGYKLIVWSGDLDTTVGGEHEIFVQAWSDAGATAVTDLPAAEFALHGSAPNPFNPSTTIAFDLPGATPVSLQVFDTAGRLVRTLLHDAVGQTGRNEVVWNGRDNGGRQAASGVYLYRVETPTHRDVGRMTLIK
jgi:FlgD Ig-like domain